ncbi:MAG: 2-amino-4-hydroxy-6-hydroxymethyldihydropteridine diphosphokinase [Roseburia sp.]|nr:2-amino-4-hydroxy-6-hydroxymethyldihydropteridine diphosphokinase [Roseburia sp.]
MDKIKITGLKVFAHHGVFEEETINGQDFYVNATLYLDCRPAGITDVLEKSVHYGEVSHFVTKFLQEHTYKLIETAAEQTVKALLLEYPLIEKIEFELCKPQAPIGLPFENVSVTIERGWHTAYVAIGSNMGDKKAYIEDALYMLEEMSEIQIKKVSDLIVTKPYGGVEQDDFVNGAIKLRTLFTPNELLDALHLVEKHAKRERLVHWGPRTLDLDIIFYDDLVYEDDELIIPHVDMANRDFVLKPLLDLCPNKRHPILGLTMTQLYERLEER